MEQLDLLRLIAQRLESLGIRYLVAGSYSSSYWGEPRFTYDIDLVLTIDASQIPVLLAAFPAPDFYLSDQAMHEAVRLKRQFNLIHPASGVKADFIIPATSRWSSTQLDRRVRGEVAEGLEAWVASAEDVIVSKLISFAEGGSEKHLRDIAGVLRVAGSRVNLDQVAAWAEELGMDDVWREVLARVKPRA